MALHYVVLSLVLWFMKLLSFIGCDLFPCFAFPFEDVLPMHTDDHFGLLLADIEASLASAQGDGTHCHLVVLLCPRWRGLHWLRAIGGLSVHHDVLCKFHAQIHFIFGEGRAHPLTTHSGTYVTICIQRPSKRQCTTAPPVPSTPLPGPSHGGMDQCSLCCGANEMHCYYILINNLHQLWVKVEIITQVW